MIVVIFEVEVKEEGKERYFALARQLTEKLGQWEGFLGKEGYQCPENPNKYVAINFWNTEQDAERWRNELLHRVSQDEGREHLFVGYKVIVADTKRVYTLLDRTQAPPDSNHLFCPERPED
ncbi:MAG: antibiotic biosynthesis monooxygenase [Pygmaiobacter massiliensis]|nr:antibiotic biosynthesis monooxygenase [Pygmaiobacter massiliensis]